MSIQKKINTNDLPNMMGQTIVIRDTPTGTDRRGIVTAIGPDGTSVLIVQGRTQFYQKTAYDPTKYIYADNIYPI